jgi:hypothetical protein
MTVNLMISKEERQPYTPLREFSDLTIQFALLARTQGINLEPLTPAGLKKFASLPVVVQKNIIQGVSSYLNMCQGALQNSLSLRGKNHMLSWWTLGQLKLRPHSDMYGHLEDDHIIEIYNADNIQIYRSFDMFQYLSYSLSEIFSFNWHELYRRNENVFAEMCLVTDKILNGQIKDIVFTSFPDHFVEEIFSPSRNRAIMRHSFFAPLYEQSGQVGGFFSAFKIVDFSQGS